MVAAELIFCSAICWTNLYGLKVRIAVIDMGCNPYKCTVKIGRAIEQTAQYLDFNTVCKGSIFKLGVCRFIHRSNNVVFIKRKCS